MFTLKLLTLFFITKSTFSSPYYFPPPWDIIYPTDSSDSSDSSESSESTSNEDIIPPGPELSDLCPDKDHSLISNSDISYLIEDIASNLRIEENLVETYYPEAEKILEKYSHELQDLQEELEDRAGHMLHILDDFADMRQRLEPDVEEIADQLQTFDVREEKYYDAAGRSITVLKQLDKYKKICKINCEDFKIDQRFGPNTHKHFLETYYVNNDMSCIKLKCLIEYITEKLNQYGEEFGQALQNDLESRNEIYAQKLHELKFFLKKAAVKEFGLTMYDMLSLQDDYHHFLRYLKNTNISTELDTIEENSAEIKLRLIGLKRDVEKYRQYCMSCNSIRRAKRDIDFNDVEIDYGTDSDIIFIQNIDEESNIVDKLLKAKIDEMTHFIQINLNSMFEELDAEFNDPDIINSYVSKLKPIQHDVEHEIKNEQEALETLQDRVPKFSLENIFALSEESKQMLQRLEVAKEYVDYYNSDYYD